MADLPGIPLKSGETSNANADVVGTSLTIRTDVEGTSERETEDNRLQELRPTHLMALRALSTRSMSSRSDNSSPSPDSYPSTPMHRPIYPKVTKATKEKVLKSINEHSLTHAIHGMDIFEVQSASATASLQLAQQNIFKRHFKVILPDSLFRRYWDLASIVMILYSTFIAFFEIAFFSDRSDSISDQHPAIDAAFLASQIFFWADVLLNFVTAYYDSEGELVTDRRRIVINYLTSWFLVDTVSNLPIEGFGRLLKALRFLRIGRLLARWAMLGVSQFSINMFKIINMTVMVGHIAACVFYYVAAMEKHTAGGPGEPMSWTYEAGICGTMCDNENPDYKDEDVDPWTQYIASLYFAFATLTTVGYGDIAANTTLERTVAIVALVLGSAIFASIVGFFSQLLQSNDEREERFFNRLKLVNSFMSANKVPVDLRAKIRTNLDLTYHSDFDFAEEFIRELSPMLQRELILHVYSQFIKDVPFLADADTAFANALILRLKNKVCFPHEYLVVEGEMVDCMYIIRSGGIECVNGFGIVETVYGKGMFFCEEVAFSHLYRTKKSYRSKEEIVELMTLPRDDIIDLMEAFPKFLEHLAVIIDERKLKRAKMIKNVNSKMSSTLEARPVTPPPGKVWKVQGGRRRSSSTKISGRDRSDRTTMFADDASHSPIDPPRTLSDGTGGNATKGTEGSRAFFGAGNGLPGNPTDIEEIKTRMTAMERQISDLIGAVNAVKGALDKS